MTSSLFSHFILFGISYLCICFMPYFSYKCLNMIDYIHFLVYMIYYSLNIYLYIYYLNYFIIILFYYYIILCARNIQTIIYPHIIFYSIVCIYIIFSHIYYILLFLYWFINSKSGEDDYSNIIFFMYMNYID